MYDLIISKAMRNTSEPPTIHSQTSNYGKPFAQAPGESLGTIVHQEFTLPARVPSAAYSTLTGSSNKSLPHLIP